MRRRKHAGRGRNKRNDWSLLGFLRYVLNDQERYERFKDLCRLLMPAVMLVIVLVLVVALVGLMALAHVDVIGGYYHLTPHASEWERWLMPPGGISVALGGIKGFRAYRRRRADALERKAEAAVAAGSEKKKALP